MARLADWGLRASGWRSDGELPSVAKYVVIAAPHTSNWDFVFTIAFATKHGIPIRWMGKHTLFKGAAGPIMRGFGGVPVDRTAAHGMVDQMCQLFRDRDELVLVVPAEGTRGRRDHWKSGFYQISRQAQVPILPVIMDYERKCVQFGRLFTPSGNVRQDMDALRAFYAGAQGKHPELFGPVRLRDEDGGQQRAADRPS